MKVLIVQIGKAFLKLLYFFIKLILPTKNQIVLMSMQSNEPSLDFELLRNSLHEKSPQTKIVCLCKKMDSGLSKKRDYIYYVLMMIGFTLKAMCFLATSTVCITESYCVPISILKHKKKLKIIQIWHASGAVKKFGYQSLDTEEGKLSKIAKLMCMHKNYSYAIAPSEVTRKIFAEAFGMKKDKIVKLGLPRLEYLTNDKYDKSEEIFATYPELRNKKIILYVPTFRKGKNVDLQEILKYPLDKEKYQLIIKLHPLEKASLSEEYTVATKFTTYDLLKIADYIITDYSVLSIEASILNKPIFLYVYDWEDYIKNRGLNIDLTEELKTFTSKNFSDIMRKIQTNDYNIEELKRYKEKYLEVNTANTIQELTNFIIN